ncbi:MAG TPA: hypothetical protein VKD22_11415, partial [Ramlibacter sp.]|nr:hypothetical protein [Ramlibacter sp.]
MSSKRIGELSGAVPARRVRPKAAPPGEPTPPSRIQLPGGAVQDMRANVWLAFAKARAAALGLTVEAYQARVDAGEAALTQDELAVMQQAMDTAVAMTKGAALADLEAAVRAERLSEPEVLPSGD